MDLRRAFVEDYLSEAFAMTELCETYQISRKTGYKVVGRFEAEGWAGLADRSRRPHTAPHRVPPTLVAAVLDVRRRKPDWGARKVRGWLIARQPNRAWPSRSAIHAIFTRDGSVRRPSRRPSPSWRRGQGRRLATAPNDVWTVDFKGDFRLGNGARCYPLTLRDLASRYTLRCEALDRPALAPTQRGLERAFAEFGLPACIRSDNGEPFAGPGLAGLSRLNISWLRLGIAVEQIDPGRPDQNGSHEQFHRVLKARTARPPAATRTAQQRRFDTFRREYNDERPHEALGDDVPAQHYAPSPRPFPRRPPRLEYPGHWEPRRVGPNGCIAWRPHPIFLSRALAGQWVALEEVADDLWTVHFGTVPLARWVARTQRLRALQRE
jgi:transposase InsO family protein